MNKKFIYIVAAALIISGGLFTALQVNKDRAVYAYNKDNLIRLHVVPHSDSTYDQALKYQVRDCVIKSMSGYLKDVEDVSEARKIVKSNLRYIEKTAEEEIEASGTSYPVRVSLGNYPFPAKSYKLAGSENEEEYLTLPQGDYEALQVVIGEGQGSNWWCVLFPPLCFTGLANEKAKDFNISPEEDASAPTRELEQEEPRVEIKFKIIELFKEKFEKQEQGK